MTPLLDIQHLSIQFKGQSKPAVSDLSLTIQQGEILGIVGESGSGKSVSAFSLLHLLPVGTKITGNARWKDGTDMLHPHPNNVKLFRGKRVGFVFQEPMSALNPTLTCGFQIIETIRTHLNLSREESHIEAIKLLEEVQLPNPKKVLASYPHQLSGGQRQRVMLAQALSSRPELLLADEPTTALDASLRLHVATLIKDICKARGMACLFISHDLHLVRHLADRTGVMYKGQLLELQPTSDLFTHPENAYTRGLLACLPALNPNAKRLPYFDAHTNEVVFPSHPQAKLESSKLILEVNGLSQTYIEKRGLGKSPLAHQVLKPCQFSLYQGKTLNVVGESGSGKSTIARLLVRLLGVKEGTIKMDQVEIQKLSDQAFKPYRKKIQMIFQDPNAALNPEHTIRQILSEPWLIHEGKEGLEEQLTRLCQAVGIDDAWLSRYPHQLSGGQKQRVSIARSLMLNPQVLICDESISALDLSLQARVLNLLKDLQQTLGFSMLFITHDLSVARFLGDDVLVLQHGEVLEYGQVEEIFSNPKHAYTQQLIDVSQV